MKDNEGNDLPTGEIITGARFGDVSELPDELISQIPGAVISQDEQNIITVLDGDFQGIGTINEIMVALWRLESIVHDRKTIATRITRMVKKGTLVSVKRGVYMTLMEIPEKTYSKDE